MRVGRIAPTALAIAAAMLLGASAARAVPPDPFTNPIRSASRLATIGNPRSPPTLPGMSMPCGPTMSGSRAAIPARSTRPVPSA